MSRACRLRTFTPLWRTGFIYNQRPAHEGPAITRLNCLTGESVVVNFDEPEPSGFTTETVPKNVHAIHVNSGLREKGLYICFCSFVGQVPHEQLCH